MTRALQRLGVISATETPSNEDMVLGLALLNSFVDSLGLDRSTMFSLVRTLKTLTSGTATYTIGTGGSINLTRPREITYARLILDSAANPVTEVPIANYTDQEWAGISQKTLSSSMVSGIYYDFGFHTTTERGLISVWPVPTVSTLQLVLYTPSPLAEFDQDTEVKLPAGYERMLEYNLTRECQGPWGRRMHPDDLKIANSSLAAVKTANARPSVLRMPAGVPGVRRARPDWRTGP